MSKNRYEIKFILNELEFASIYLLTKNLELYERYPARKVNSLYFDTSDFSFVKENLSGNSIRNKIRLRWYSENEKPPELEIKKREGRLGYKTKYMLDQIRIEDFDQLNMKKLNKLIFDSVIKNYKYDMIFNTFLYPILKVNYERQYFETQKGIRATLDKRIKFSPLSLYNKIDYYQEISYPKIILELKFPLELKLEASKLIRKLNLTPSRHSKYLAGVSKLGYSSYI
jgi:hypothetical protein